MASVFNAVDLYDFNVVIFCSYYTGCPAFDRYREKEMRKRLIRDEKNFSKLSEILRYQDKEFR